MLLTLDQASEIAGQAEQTIRNLISQNRTTLPTRRVGGRQVVHVFDLAAWLDEQRVAPNARHRCLVAPASAPAPVSAGAIRFRSWSGAAAPR